MAKDAGGIGDLLKQAQQMSKDLGKMQHDLKERVVEGTAGGGAVKVAMNGQRDVLSVSIDPSVMEDADASMLEDLLVSALRDAKEHSDRLAAEEMSKVTGLAMPPGAM